MADIYQEEELNFFRLLKTFLNMVNEVLRLCFKQQWNDATGQEWENDAKSGQYFIAGERLGERKSKLFAPKYAKTLEIISDGDISKWDSTTLFFALLYSKSIHLADPSKGYRKIVVCRRKPFTLGEHIDHLREIRNIRLFHVDRPRIEKSEFEEKMNDIYDTITAIIGKDHEILAEIIKLKSENFFETSEVNSLRRTLDIEKRNSVSFQKNLNKLEDQIENLARKLSLEDKHELKCEALKDTSSEVSVLRAENRIKKNSEELKNIQSRVIEIMYPNRPELTPEYKFVINTSNKFSYEFAWENFHEFIDEILHEKSGDRDIVLFAKVQLAKGLSHQGKKEDALKLLKELVKCVYQAKNSAVLLARIFYRLAYIYHDLKDTLKANQNVLLAEQILVTSESYEDRAEIEYAKANILLAGCSNHDHCKVIDCLNNSLESTRKSMVDTSVLERQALLRNSLAHLGYLQHTIKTDIKDSDVRTASELLDKFVSSCCGELSKRNQLFQYICQSLLAHHQNNHQLAIGLAEDAHGIAVKYGLIYERKQAEMLKSFLKLPNNTVL